MLKQFLLSFLFLGLSSGQEKSLMEIRDTINTWNWDVKCWGEQNVLKQRLWEKRSCEHCMQLPTEPLVTGQFVQSNLRSYSFPLQPASFHCSNKQTNRPDQIIVRLKLRIDQFRVYNYKMDADQTCELVLSLIRKSNLNFTLNETPFSVAITMKKAFIKNKDGSSRGSSISENNLVVKTMQQAIFPNNQQPINFPNTTSTIFPNTNPFSIQNKMQTLYNPISNQTIFPNHQQATHNPITNETIVPNNHQTTIFPIPNETITPDKEQPKFYPLSSNMEQITSSCIPNQTIINTKQPATQNSITLQTIINTKQPATQNPIILQTILPNKQQKINSTIATPTFVPDKQHATNKSGWCSSTPRTPPRFPNFPTLKMPSSFPIPNTPPGLSPTSQSSPLPRLSICTPTPKTTPPGTPGLPKPRQDAVCGLTAEYLGMTDEEFNQLKENLDN